MPSGNATEPERATRRRVLATAGSGLAGAFAGCSGVVPGSGPARRDTEVTRERDSRPTIVWRYPPSDGDDIGYAAVELGRPVRRDGQPRALRLTFNSTVGGLAAGPSREGYRQDWFRFRLRPPRSYEGGLAHAVRVEPPEGQWDDFTVAYDVVGGVRRTTLRLGTVDTAGTVEVDAVFDPGGNPLPDRLRCSFTVQATRPGFLLDEAVRVTDDAWLPVPEH